MGCFPYYNVGKSSCSYVSNIILSVPLAVMDHLKILSLLAFQ